MSETIINVFLIMSGVAVTIIAIALLVLLVLTIKIFKEVRSILKQAKEGTALALQDWQTLHKTIINNKGKLGVVTLITSAFAKFGRKKKRTADPDDHLSD